MSRFRFRAYDKQGVLTEGEIEARSREQALEALHQRGQFPLDVTGGDGPAKTAPNWWNRDITFGDGSLPLAGLTIFTRELATLVKADLTLDDALRIVSLQPLIPRRIKTATLSILESIRQGDSLSGALAARGKEFPEYYWRLIQAGEASGSLAEVLDDLAKFLERASDVRSQVGSALLYPAVLLFAALGALTVILTVLIPTIVPLFKDAGAPLPPTLQFLVDGQSFLASNWAGVLIAATAALLAIILALRNTAIRSTLHRALLRIPILGGIIANRETARFARTLATLTHSGVPMLEAVRISGSVLQNQAFTTAVAKAGQALQEGGNLSQPLLRSGLFSELSMRLIAIGEQTGQLESMLMRVAEVYEATLQRQLTRLMSLLTPVLTLVIGGLVGGLILSVMSAILKVNELAGL
ncbi:MAG: type II secretion system F family protein [Hyphomicrobiaceae bacterium]